MHPSHRILKNSHTPFLCDLNILKIHRTHCITKTHTRTHRLNVMFHRWLRPCQSQRCRLHWPAEFLLEARCVKIDSFRISDVPLVDTFLLHTMSLTKPRTRNLPVHEILPKCCVHKEFSNNPMKQCLYLYSSFFYIL